jgi:hypothetical protein
MISCIKPLIPVEPTVINHAVAFSETIPSFCFWLPPFDE